MVASIPSPSSGNLDLGPLSFHVYGLLLAIGVVIAVKMTMVRWGHKGGTPADILDGALVVVISGVVGARVYHVITDYQLFDDGRWADALKIWKGGLSIWGAVIGGAIAVIVICHRRHLPTLVVMDCMGPGIVLAQAIGRWGNYFNQELFGKPTTLPWGLEISLQNRPLGYEKYSTFQPTFLYESLACLAIAGILLLVEHRARLKIGQTFALYVALYTFARFFFETMRIDPAHEIAGMRVNAWVSVFVFLFGIAWFVWLGRHEPEQRRPGDTSVDDSNAPVPADGVS